jgi:hypothetical protein
MNRQYLIILLQATVEEEIPSPNVTLWPDIKERLVKRKYHLFKKGVFMNRPAIHFNRAQKAVFISVLVIGGITCAFATPQGHTVTQAILHFFTHSDKDAYPLQPWQLTPLSAKTETIFYATEGADPASVNNAHLTVNEVEKRVGFHVLEPTWLPDVRSFFRDNPVPTWMPDGITFYAANYDPIRQIAYLFYQFPGLEPGTFAGLGLAEGHGPIIENNCQSGDVLCGTIGASAAVETVKIGDVTGEYVEGYWHLTDSGPVWEHDSSQKTMRWQENGMFFQLGYTGGPEIITKEDMIKIAESLK